jgi:phosphatidylinositol glycan class U
MWWYFFTEMFDHFRAFFLGVFQVSGVPTTSLIQLHTLVYVAPVCLRLQHDPLVAILVLVGVFSTWKSYPTLGDTALWAGLLGCFRDVTKSEPRSDTADTDLRHPLFILTVSLYTLILLPLLHSLWLLTGTGNANFFYAATMVHGLNSSLAVVDILTAALRRDIRAGVTLEIGWRDLWNIVQFTRA